MKIITINDKKYRLGREIPDLPDLYDTYKVYYMMDTIIKRNGKVFIADLIKDAEILPS